MDEVTKETVARPDVGAIMAAIRDKVRADVKKVREGRLPFKGQTADSNGQSQWPAGKLLASEDLRFINRNHSYATTLKVDCIKTHRRGLVGRILIKAKQKLARWLRFAIFADYFSFEAEFDLNLVRFLNDTCCYIDGRDAAIFWELIRKIDHDVNGVIERLERVSDEQMATLRSSEKSTGESLRKASHELLEKVNRLEGTLSVDQARLGTLESVAAGLERVVASFCRAAPPAQSTASLAQSEGVKRVNADYLLLENRFRGSEEEISRRLSIYPPMFKGAEGPVLEIGPGRGELLSLFANSGIKAYGVEIDEAMAEVSRGKGLEVVLEDGLSHLSSLADGSLGGIVAVQVVEHLSMDKLKELFSLCTKKVRKGGTIVFETINPQSVLALSSNYFRDPSHVWPLHPDTLSYAMTLSGLQIVEVRKLSPVPEAATLRKVPVHDYMPPRWKETVEVLNHNTRLLNDFLFGFQDYCVVARV